MPLFLTTHQFGCLMYDLELSHEQSSPRENDKVERKQSFPMRAIIDDKIKRSYRWNHSGPEPNRWKLTCKNILMLSEMQMACLNFFSFLKFLILEIKVHILQQKVEPFLILLSFHYTINIRIPINFRSLRNIADYIEDN